MTTRGPAVDYRSLFDTMLDGLAYCHMVYDRKRQPVDFTFLQVNKNYEALTGMKRVVGKKVTELLPDIKESSPEMLAAYARVSRTGRPERLEIYIKTLSRWFAISVYSPRKDYFIAIFQNITDQKHLEKELENAKIAARNVLEDLQVEKETLAHEKAKDEAMLASIGDGVIIVDLAGKITFLNESAERLLGWKSAETVGAMLSDIVPVEDEQGDRMPAKARPVAIALSTGITTTHRRKSARPSMTIPGVYYYVRKDKTKFPVAMTFSRVVLDNKIVGAIEVFRDITKERDVDRAKTEFVSLASHQLRTPLSSVRWYSEMLLEGDAGALNEKQQRYLSEIQHGNLRMIGLVNTLLNISRLELGTAEVQVENVRLASAVEEVLRDLEARRRAQAISITVDIPSSLPPLLTDAKLLRIVIENLLSNAIKYTPAQGAVKVSAREVAAGEEFNTKQAEEASVGFSVIDNGIGIPENEQAQIFTKLFRTENARELDADGTGLGLYLTRLVLERMRGRIWFSSRTGEGTAFSILLPFSSSDQQP